MNKIENISVLFLASWYPSEKKPFNGIFIYKHARAIAQTNNKVSVLSIEVHSLTETKIVEDTREKVLQVKVLFPSKRGRLQARARFKAFMFGFNYLKNRQKIDIVHANVTLPAGIVARRIKKKYGIPYVITEHSTIYLPTSTFDLPFYKKPFVKSALKNSSAVFPVSKDLEKNLKLISAQSVFKVVPNVVDTEIFSIRNEPSFGVRYLHISNLSEQKNIEELLEVFKNFQTEFPNSQLTIVAETGKEAAETLIEKFNLTHTQILSGLDELGVAKVMREHDVFVLFSLTENLPCVLIEAQSCGLSIVSSDVGGISEIVDDDSLGILVPSRDKSAFYKALSYTAQNLNQYKKESIRERAIRTYSNQVIAQQYLTSYTEVLHSQKKLQSR